MLNYKVTTKMLKGNKGPKNTKSVNYRGNLSITLSLLFSLWIASTSYVHSQTKYVKFDSKFFLTEFKKSRCNFYQGKGKIPLKQVLKIYRLDEKSDTSNTVVEKTHFTKEGYISYFSIQENESDFNSYKNVLSKNQLTKSIHKFKEEVVQENYFIYAKNSISSVGINSDLDTIQIMNSNFYPKEKSITYEVFQKDYSTNKMKLFKQDSLVFNVKGQVIFQTITESTEYTKFSNLFNYKEIKNIFVYNNNDLLKKKKQTVLFDNKIPDDTLVTTYEYDKKGYLTRSFSSTPKEWVVEDKRLTYNGSGQCIEIKIFKNRAEKITQKLSYVDDKLVRIVTTNNFQDGTVQVIDFTRTYR